MDVQRNHVRKSECKVLAGHASAVMYAVQTSEHINHSQLLSGCLLVEKTISRLQTDLGQWKNYSNGLAFFKDSDVLSRIELRGEELNQALNVLGLTSAFKQEDWSLETANARSVDQALFQEMSQRQADVRQKVDKLKQPLARPSGSRSQGTLGSETGGDRANMIQQMSQIRSEEFGFLAPGDLEHEVQKTGERPFHSSSMYELWKGIWLGKHSVVMKVLRGKEFDGRPTEEDHARTDRQVGVWRSLKHPNVLQCCGFVLLEEGDTGGMSICSVTPWLSHRDAMRYIQFHPDANRMQLVHGAAKGLQYLHSVGIQHDALQGSNVLVDDQGNAVLSDFSITKTPDQDAVMTRTGSGPSLRWSAPETVNDQILSIQADVYSWAMTALEIVSGLEPYHGTISNRQLMNAIRENRLPQRDDYTTAATVLLDDRLWKLLLSCWEGDPDKRPTMDQVVEQLDAMELGFATLSDVTHHIPFPGAIGDAPPADHATSLPAVAGDPKDGSPSVPSQIKRKSIFAKVIKTLRTWIGFGML
ncbi:hypothetical protein FRB97_006406 [Tulasnella sp. 331]|nr:hypothetical protein FRB97_006406 [Tulasnella sp. 331]